MRIISNIFLIVSMVIAPLAAFAATTVTEGAEAKNFYEKEKGSAKVLVQKDKAFTLRDKGVDTPNPKNMTVKVGERFFIINDEAQFVHNVYDASDKSWVLQKQEPTGVASISFDTAGEHKLRCAIHPQMKIDVKVE